MGLWGIWVDWVWNTGDGVCMVANMMYMGYGILEIVVDRVANMGDWVKYGGNIED